MIKQVWVTQNVTDSRATDVEGVGSLRIEEPNVYRWVKNGETAVDFVVGDVVCFDPANMLKQIKKPVAAGLMLLAGVVASTSIKRKDVAGNPCFGWIQCLGIHTAVKVAGSSNTTFAIGNYLKAVNAQVYATGDAATQPLYKSNIQLLEAIVTTASYQTTPWSASDVWSCFVSTL